MGSVGNCSESPEGESAALDESARSSADESPATAEAESTLGTLEFDGGSASFSGEAVELLGREAGSTEAIMGDWVGLAFFKKHTAASIR